MVYNAPGQNLNNLDSWNYGFEAENGIKQSASGSMKQVGEEEFVVMRGSYQYIGSDGKFFLFSEKTKFRSKSKLILVKLILFLFHNWNHSREFLENFAQNSNSLSKYPSSGPIRSNF
jgi:hypothetical protein